MSAPVGEGRLVPLAVVALSERCGLSVAEWSEISELPDVAGPAPDEWREATLSTVEDF